MATNTRSDELRDALVSLYGTGLSVSDLLRRYREDFPTAPKWMTGGWLDFIKSRGATGVSHSDIDFDFWKRRLNSGSFTPLSTLTSGKLKAYYDVSQSSGATLASDDFTRVPTGPVVKVSDTFTRTPVVSDDFSEIDGTNLNGKVTDTGQTWSVVSGAITI